MFCEHCGSNISDNAAFCKRCGKALDRRFDHQTVADGRKDGGKKIGSNLIEGPDGSLSWVYELSFWSNPTILITVFKVMLLALAFPVVLAFVLGLEDGIAEAGTLALTMLAICGAIMTVLLIVAYVLVGLAYGGKYQVLFKMDNKGIHHIQLKKQYDRAAAIGLLTALAGLAGGNLSAVGAGLLGSTRQSMYTAFADVTSVRINKRRSVIYINEGLAQNHVYAESEDISVIKTYILDRLPKSAQVR